MRIDVRYALASALALSLGLVPASVSAQLDPDEAAVDIEDVEVEPDEDAVVEDDDADGEAGTRIEPDDARAVDPDRLRTINPDGVRTINPDSGDSIRPDDARVIDPDGGQAVRPDEAETIAPDEGDVIRVDGEVRTLDPDDANVISPDEASAIDPDVGGTAVDPEAGEPIDPDAASKLDEGELRVVANRRASVIDDLSGQVVADVSDMRSSERDELGADARRVRGRLDDLTVELDNLQVAYEQLGQRGQAGTISSMRQLVDTARSDLATLQRVRDPNEILQRIESLDRTLGRFAADQASLQIPSTPR